MGEGSTPPPVGFPGFPFSPRGDSGTALRAVAQFDGMKLPAICPHQSHAAFPGPKQADGRELPEREVHRRLAQLVAHPNGLHLCVVVRTATGGGGDRAPGHLRFTLCDSANRVRRKAQVAQLQLFCRSQIPTTKAPCTQDIGQIPKNIGGNNIGRRDKSAPPLRQAFSKKDENNREDEENK